MERIDKVQYYLDIAKTVALRGTCLKRNYGAVIVNNDEIISTGYTGSPRGCENCIVKGKCMRQENNIPGKQRYELCKSVHAEMNAIISASRKDMIDATIYLVGVNPDGAIHRNASCCDMCKKMILNAGIKYVVIAQGYNVHKMIPTSDFINDINTMDKNISDKLINNDSLCKKPEEIIKKIIEDSCINIINSKFKEKLINNLVKNFHTFLIWWKEVRIVSQSVIDNGNSYSVRYLHNDMRKFDDFIPIFGDIPHVGNKGICKKLHRIIIDDEYDRGYTFNDFKEIFCRYMIYHIKHFYHNQSYMSFVDPDYSIKILACEFSDFIYNNREELIKLHLTK